MNKETNRTFVALVDDDSSLCRALARLLAAGGIQSRCYPSAEAFLNDQKNPPPACLLMDLQLGGMSGFDLQRHMITRGRLVPTIFITADDSPDARDRALSAGCDGFFLKTDPGHSILWAVRRVLSAVAAT